MNCKDTTCILPFVHFYTQSDGEVKACCIADGFKNKQTLEKSSIADIFNSDDYKELRLDMLNGKRNKVCDVCYKKEDRGEESPRQMFNTNTLWEMPKVREDGSVSTNFQHVDIRFSNLCNFKCRMCHHIFSSNWFEDSKKIKVGNSFPFLYDENRKVLRASKTIVQDIIPYLKKVKSFYFAGGEPLITNEHYELLKWLHKNVKETKKENITYRELSLHYNTNLSTIKYDEDELIKYWKSFRKVKLAISCDGVFEVGEYQRTGFNHLNFIKNLKEIKKYATPESDQSLPFGFTYSFQYTTTIFNIEHIFDFIDFMIDEEYIELTDTIDFFYAWTPEWSSINNLSERDKSRINKLFNRKIKKITSEKTKNQLFSILNYMNSNSNYSLSDMKNIVEQIDEVNNTDYKKICNLNFEEYVRRSTI